MTAQIIQLFPKKTCFHCVNAYLGRHGVFCEVVRDFIQNETVAHDCEAFEEDSDGTTDSRPPAA